MPLRWSNLARDAPASAHRFSMNPAGAVRKRSAAPSHYGRRSRLAPKIRLPSWTLELTSWLATDPFWQPRVPPSIWVTVTDPIKEDSSLGHLASL